MMIHPCILRPADPPGGTFALYTLISRHAKVSLIPNQQVEEDDLVAKYNRDKAPATLRRAEWMKELLETNKAVKVSLFLITMLATAMVISDAILTPAISGIKHLDYLISKQISTVQYAESNTARSSSSSRVETCSPLRRWRSQREGDFSHHRYGKKHNNNPQKLAS